MKRTFIFICCMVLNFFMLSAFAWAGDNANQQDSLAGMEIIKVGQGEELLVPKGTKTHKIGAQLFVEDRAQSIMNQIVALEKRLQELELANLELKKEILELKK